VQGLNIPNNKKYFFINIFFQINFLNVVLNWMIINVTSPIVIIIRFPKINYYVYNNIENISESFDIIIDFWVCGWSF
jgi:hypothetical protein